MLLGSFVVDMEKPFGLRTLVEIFFLAFQNVTYLNSQHAPIGGRV